MFTLSVDNSFPDYDILRHNADEKYYDDTKTEAENNLTKAEDTLKNNKKAKSMEIARLTAQLRKSEMNITSLEKEIDQKVISEYN